MLNLISVNIYFFNHAIMLPCFLVVADTYQQYIPRIPFKGFWISLFLDLLDGRIGAFIPLQLHQLCRNHVGCHGFAESSGAADAYKALLGAQDTV